MLLCNGLFCTTQYFVPWLRHFPKTYRVVQFDYRSHGRSAEAPDPHRVTMDRLVDDAAAVMQQACPSQLIVVGHSMGVRVALELYRLFPGRISHLILLCGSSFNAMGPIPDRSPFRELITSTLWLAGRTRPAAQLAKDITLRTDLVSKVAYLLGGMSYSLTPRVPVEALLAHLERLDVRMMTTLARSYINHTAQTILPTVRAPTLYLVGELDSLAPPSHARAAARLLPNAEVCVIDGCTHLAPVERPGRVHDEVEAFLRRHGAPP
jgi:pimeloyl-ACP methyl ester carboxylesterase